MSLYLTLKALHLIAMVAWFAGLFYLPRLFVYRVERPEAAAVLDVMAFKLSRYIMLPAAAVTLLCGVGMLMLNPDIFLTGGWVHVKLTLVAVLVAYHLSLELHRLALVEGRNRKSGRFFRLYNEVPTLLLVAIILLAVLRPF